MQEIYFVSCEVDGIQKETKIYTNSDEAMNSAKALIVEYSEKMNVAKYLSTILSGKYARGYLNKKYRKAIARYMYEFLSSSLATEIKSDYVFNDDPNDYVDEDDADSDSFNDFECYCQAGCTVLEFKFGNRLLIDSDILTDPMTTDGYFRIKNKNTDFKLVILTKQFDPFFADGSAKSQNILSVYCTLDSSPKGLEALQKHILEHTGALLSTKTIGEHISALKTLGFPIEYKYRSCFEAEYGYYLAQEELDSISDADMSNMGSNVYLMLVIITLERTKNNMRASEIIYYISEHFNVTMSKSTVLRHLKFLVDIGWAKAGNGKYIYLDPEV